MCDSPCRGKMENESASLASCCYIVVGPCVTNSPPCPSLQRCVAATALVCPISCVVSALHYMVDCVDLASSLVVPASRGFMDSGAISRRPGVTTHASCGCNKPCRAWLLSVSLVVHLLSSQVFHIWVHSPYFVCNRLRVFVVPSPLSARIPWRDGVSLL